MTKPLIKLNNNVDSYGNWVVFKRHLEEKKDCTTVMHLAMTDV